MTQAHNPIDVIHQELMGQLHDDCAGMQRPCHTLQPHVRHPAGRGAPQGLYSLG